MKTVLRPCSLAIVALTFGCSSSTPTRNLTGQLSMSAYTVKSPVIIARSSAGRTFIASVSSTGAFKLTVPTGASYRLSLADRSTSSAFAAVSRIAWPIAARARWAKVNAGSTVSFGVVHPRGTSTTSASGLKTSSDGTGGDTSGSDGNNDGNDGSDGAGDVTQCGSQTEQTGDNMTEQTDNCEDDGAEMCDASDETDSEGDAPDQSGVESADDAQSASGNQTDTPCTGATTPPAGGTAP